MISATIHVTLCRTWKPTAQCLFFWSGEYTSIKPGLCSLLNLHEWKPHLSSKPASSRPICFIKQFHFKPGTYNVSILNFKSYIYKSAQHKTKSVFSYQIISRHLEVTWLYCLKLLVITLQKSLWGFQQNANWHVRLFIKISQKKKGGNSISLEVRNWNF